MLNEELLYISTYEQGSIEWHTEKMGVQSASKGELYLVDGKNVGNKNPHKLGGGLLTYIDKLAYKFAEEVPNFDNWSTASATWGIETEPMARREFSKRNMCKVEELGFISSKEHRIGYSPDLHIVGVKEGGEIKCYDSPNHLDIVLSGIVPKKVIAQCQWSLMVSDFEVWNAIFYDPRLVANLQYRQFRIERDEAMIDVMRTKAIVCSKMIDDLLDKMGLL